MKAVEQNKKKSAKSVAKVLPTPFKATNQLQHTPSQFDKDEIGHFVLKLYHDQRIQPDGLIPKETARREFKEYVKINSYGGSFGNANVGTLLHNTNFMYNTPRGSDMYCISMKRLFDFRNEKLKQLDDARTRNSSADDFIWVQAIDSTDKPLEATIEMSPDAEEFPVIYQGGFEQEIVPKFTLTSLGCFICQRNFQRQSHFEDHISIHGFDSDFKFLSTTQSKKKNVFEIIYRLCNESHYFNFTMKTKEKDIIIEKIIIVQTRLMQYIKNNKVPYEISTDGIDSFLVDSHLFTIGQEQPIVVVYRYKFDKTTRFVEQHHFLRTEEFPQVHFPIRSCRVPHNQLMKTKFKLADYYPSPTMKIAQKEHFSDTSLCEISENMRKYIIEEKKLNARNMFDVLNTVLQIEDLEGMRDYTTLRQKGAKINRFGREYSVKLRGLPKHIFLENIVTPLDEIILIPSNSEHEFTNENPKQNGRKGGQRKTKYFAVVERVYYNQVCFKYDKCVINEREPYDIILRPSRLSLKYQFRALDMISGNVSMLKYLFPSDCNFRKDISITDLTLFNSTIATNPEQLQAVRNIADGPNMFAPYVIFGPPGTGKTSTIVEAVLQLWQRRPDTRILITAGSNGACDEVALRLCRVLIDLQPDKPNILRIFAKSNEKRLDSIEDILIEASNFYRAHFYPAVEVIREYRIIVCTLSVVGKLVTANIGNDFFSHIFIDECAASTESEALVGVMGVSSTKMRLIVSGDHKQLGPIIKSNRAIELGLNVSFMERMMNQSCYAVNETGDYDRSIQTRLIQNFRSHPKIVNLYNSMFYGGELKAMAKKDDIDWALQWHMLPNKNHPIIFHSVYGNCKRNGHAVSLCNELEVEAVLDYVKDLMYFGIKGRKIEETDIGIISPYKKQYTRIQEELNLRRWHQIEVGAVETFQGKEKHIIIVSTVRSFTKTLGFLDNPRRLNVILSRAKCLLIMIGNPKTLSQNKDFKHIIDECRRNKCTVGGFRGYNDEKSAIEKEDINSKEMSLEGFKLSNSTGATSNSKNRIRQPKKKTNTSGDTPRISNRIQKKTNSFKNVSVTQAILKNFSDLNLKSQVTEAKETHLTITSPQGTGQNISIRGEDTKVGSSIHTKQINLTTTTPPKVNHINSIRGEDITARLLSANLQGTPKPNFINVEKSEEVFPSVWYMSIVPKLEEDIRNTNENRLKNILNNASDMNLKSNTFPVKQTNLTTTPPQMVSHNVWNSSQNIKPSSNLQQGPRQTFINGEKKDNRARPIFEVPRRYHISKPEERSEYRYESGFNISNLSPNRDLREKEKKPKTKGCQLS